MTIYVMPADNHGCGHYRLIWPAIMLHHAGVPIKVLDPSKKVGLPIKTEEDEQGRVKLTGIGKFPDMDVLVMQRTASAVHPAAVTALRDMGVAVVIDMDDDMSTLHPGNAGFDNYRNAARNGQSWKHAAEACKRATLVTTSTKALQRVYAKHGRGRVLDNYVPAEYLSIPKPETGNFGWAGTTRSHPDDLQTAGGSVRQLQTEGHSFFVVGGPSEVQRVLKLDAPPASSPPVDTTEWAMAIANGLDVGMAPLAPSTFNRSKSRLKCIEMMSVGVPWVSSPREEYSRLYRESGCGLLAATPKEWYAQLKRLLTDDVLRKEQAERGREYMRDQTYQAQAWRWAEAWTDAIKIQQAS